MNELLSLLDKKGFCSLLGSYSALDRYFHIKEPGALYINTNATLVSLAKEFEGLSYPGFPFADALLNHSNTCVYFRCVDNLAHPFPEPFSVMSLLYDTERGVFIDPLGIYRDIRKTELFPMGPAGRIENPGTWTPSRSGIPGDMALISTAVLISRYHYEVPGREAPAPRFSLQLSKEMQKHLLISILEGRNSWKGLTFLNDMGFIEKYWPDLFKMCKVKHSKDYHPEGDVWEHTMETFKYRKKTDLILSLALLLHDIGKPAANRTAAKPFHEHSEIGARIASRFLAHLGFSREMQESIYFLVRFHMIPWALNKLPLYRTEKLMDSPLFPYLLELYRADVSSTFRGPESYYEACRVYRHYMKSKGKSYKTA